MTELSHSNKTMMTEFKTFPDRQVWKPPFTWFLNLSFPKKTFRPTVRKCKK